MFEVGNKVKWKAREGDVVSGVVLKIYETTFGAKVKDTALQVQLNEKRMGRMTTVIRANKCSIVKEPRTGGRKIVPDGTFNGKKCCICGEPAKARIYSTKGTCVNERYCLKCYRETKSLLPLDREKGYKIGV